MHPPRAAAAAVLCTVAVAVPVHAAQASEPAAPIVMAAVASPTSTAEPVPTEEPAPTEVPAGRGGFDRGVTATQLTGLALLTTVGVAGAAAATRSRRRGL